MHELEVPDPLAGGGVEADEALGEQVVSGAVAAIGVVGGRFDRQVDVPQLQVGGHRRPDTRVAGIGPGVVLPGVVAELTCHRDGVKDPASLAGPYVVTPNEPGRVLLGRRKGRLRRPDDDDVLHNDRWRRRPDGAGSGSRSVEVIVEIDNAFQPESRIGQPGLRIERDQIVAGGDVDDAPLGAVGPVRHTAVVLTWRGLSSSALVVAPHPARLARLGIDRDHVALGSRRDVQHAIDHQRRGLVVGLRTRPGVLRRPAPRDREVLDGVLVDLVEGRVSRAAGIAVVEPPLAVDRPGLRRGHDGSAEQAGEQCHNTKAYR